MAIPDFFSYGEGAEEEFEEIQKRYNPGLSASKTQVCGNLIYDNYSKCGRNWIAGRNEDSVWNF